MSEASVKFKSISDAILQIQTLKAERRYSEIVALTSAFPDSILAAHPSLLIAQAGSLSHLRNHTAAQRTLERGANTIRRSQDIRLISQWGLLLGIQYLHTGNTIKGVHYLEDAITAAESVGNLRVVADASNSIGVVHSFRGDVTEGLMFFRRALYAWQSLGSSHGVGMAHHNIAMLLRDWGDLREALVHFEEAEAFYTREGIAEERINLRSEKALCYADIGDEKLARLLSNHALDELTSSTSGAVVAAAYRVAAIIDARAGYDVQAYGHLVVALQALGSEDAGILRAEILEEFAVLLKRMTSPKADAHYQLAHDAYGRVTSVRHQARLRDRYGSA